MPSDPQEDTQEDISAGALEVDAFLNVFAKNTFPAIRQVHTQITGVPGGPWFASLGVEYDPARLTSSGATFRSQVRECLAEIVQRLREGGALNDDWLRFATVADLDGAGCAPYRYFFA
jgi:hypothetical protein